jgi:hypothetical protein
MLTVALKWNSRRHARVTVILVGVCAVTACGRSRTAARGCSVTGGADAAERAVATRACEYARSRFALLFGDPVPGAAVELRSQVAFSLQVQPDHSVLVHWPDAGTQRRTITAIHDGIGGGANADAENLSHEISHVLLIARFYPDSTNAQEYGSAFADWFDEAVAMWAEPDDERANRIERARNLDSAAVHLDAILREPHSAMDAAARSITTTVTGCKPAGDPDFCKNRGMLPGTRRSIDARGKVTVDTIKPGSPDEAKLAFDDAFYSRAIALLTFIYERGGRVATAELAARLKAGKTHDVLLGLPGLPSSQSALDQQWTKWLYAR